MEGSRAAEGPLRIDVATSQIEGGQAEGWIEPNRASGCVAYCEPRDAFSRFVQPHLEAAIPPQDETSALPQSVAVLISGLKAAHLRLYRENHSLMKEPKWVRLTAACADEGRIYFVRTQTSWIYLLRAGKAHLLGGQECARPAGEKEEALGGPERLRLKVTSIEVSRDDQVLLVIGDADQPPDLYAVARLFTESRDLKRACDGLVNLLGLHGPSAAVVAYRFTPLMSGAREPRLDLARGEEVLEEITEMAREFAFGVQEESAAMLGRSTEPAVDKQIPAPVGGAPAPGRQPEPQPVPEPPHPAVQPQSQTQSQAAAQPQAGPQPQAQPRTEVQPETARPVLLPQAADSGKMPIPGERKTQPVAALRPAQPVAQSKASPPATPLREQTAPPAPGQAAEPGAQPVIRAQKGSSRPERPRASVISVILLAIILFILAVLLLNGAGWPGVVNMLRTAVGFVAGQGSSLVAYSLVDVTSEPPGAIVAIDGERIPGRTPISDVRVASGMRIITMHLGATGVWADSISLEPDRSQQVHADFLGSLRIRARDQTGNPKVWLEGQTEKRAAPAQFTDLPAGWYRIFFEDERVPLWERKVLIRSGETTGVEVNNDFGAGKVLLHVESMRIVPPAGLRPSEGDSVFLNGNLAGLTPLELEVAPGLHGVKVVSNGQEYCEVLRLPAGASRFITPQFGLRRRPSFRHVPPGKVLLQGPILLAVEIGMEDGGLRRPQLRLPEIPGGPRMIPLVQVDSGQDLFVGKLESGAAEIGRPILYYFSVMTPEGDEVVSDLYRLVPVASLEDLAAGLSAS